MVCTSYSTRTESCTSNRAWLIWAFGKFLRDELTQYPIVHESSRATNHDPLVRLLGLLQVLLRLLIAAKPVLALQSIPKIFRAFEEKRKHGGQNQAPSEDKGAPLTIPIALVPCYSSLGPRRFRFRAP